MLAAFPGRLGRSRSRRAGRTAGASSTARCGSARSGSGRPGRRRRPTRSTVVIDPGRAFGTGAHPSTRLCLELLLEEPPGSLLDIGCGSGVISIAAARLGFAPVDGARHRRGRRRGHARERRRERRRDRDAAPRPTPAPVRSRMPTSPSRTSRSRRSRPSPRRSPPRGSITAGYLAADLPELYPFRHAGRRELDGWAADLFVRDR